MIYFRKIQIEKHWKQIKIPTLVYGICWIFERIEIETA